MFWGLTRSTAWSQFFKSRWRWASPFAVLNASSQPTLEPENARTTSAAVLERAGAHVPLQRGGTGHHLPGAGAFLYSLYALIPAAWPGARAVEAGIKYILFGRRTALSLFGLAYILAASTPATWPP